MHYTPRTIACVCELQHPPVAPDPRPIQRIHNRMFESGDPLYRSFTVTHEGAVLSNPVARPDAVSSAAFLAGRIQFREENTGLTVEEFSARARSLTEMVAAERGIQVFTAQIVTIRTLVNPRNFHDSRKYLEEGMFGFAGETQSLGREPQLWGIRMVFPATPEQPQIFALRIESFQNDPRSLFIENQGTFPMVLVARGLESIAANVETAYRFVVDNALRFVANFDAKAAEA